MNELTVFKNEKFGEVRTVEKNGNTLFCGSDVAKALGYKRPADAISSHCKGSVICRVLTNGGMQDVKFITEGDIYRLAAKSDLPGADEFEKWIFDEVLPSIRKTGGYVNNDELFIQTYLPFADENTKALFRTTLQTISAQNKLIQEQKPFVEFADHISQSTNSIDVGTFAKIISKKFVNVGRTRLFKWLKQNKYLMKDNRPYQQYIDSGYFEVIEQTYKTPYGDVRTSPKTLVTGKGQIYFTEKIKSDFTN